MRPHCLSLILLSFGGNAAHADQSVFAGGGLTWTSAHSRTGDATKARVHDMLPIVYPDVEQWRNNVGYQFELPISLQVTYESFGDFARRGAGNTWLAGDGLAAGAYLTLPVRAVQLELGTGLLRWQTQAHAGSTTVGSDAGFCPFGSVGLRVTLPKNMFVGSAYNYYQDVAGTSIHSLAIIYGFKLDFIR